MNMPEQLIDELDYRLDVIFVRKGSYVKHLLKPLTKFQILLYNIHITLNLKIKNI